MSRPNYKAMYEIAARERAEALAEVGKRGDRIAHFRESVVRLERERDEARDLANIRALDAERIGEGK